MDAAKKSRKVQRALFTKCRNCYVEKCGNANVSLSERQVALQLLESRFKELEKVNTEYLELLVEEDTDEATLEAEIEAHDDYKLKFYQAKQMMVDQIVTNQSEANAVNNAGYIRNEKPFKRPTLEIPKFSGSVSKWLQFWSHFRKYHEDKSLSNEDKLEYLKQAMESGSKAESIVHGYPTTAENYTKAFESLKSRFGRDELLIEFYTRELHSLVLQNASNKGSKVSVSAVFDKLSAHIRALETLGVTTNNCATMLYPLVESSLPEEILRTWQRAEVNTTRPEGEEQTDRLKRLLGFLKTEVENEERITMAMQGFSLQDTTEKKTTKEDFKKKQTSAVATASALLTSEDKRKKCVFCNDSHENAACDKAKTMSSDTIKNLLKEGNCCFKCVKYGHAARKCRVRVNCDKCSGSHATIMCSSVPSIANGVEAAKTESVNKEQNMASSSYLPEVYMQTLRVVVYSDLQEREARVVIDSGSQRSYIRTEVAKFLGYVPVATKTVTHSLFGGVNTENRHHEVYSVRMRSCDRKYACNFEVMNQNIICDNIPCVKENNFLHELKQHGIEISDSMRRDKNCDSTIDVLIGADIAGKLLTGNKYELNNGIVAFETKLGWTIMGKNPTAVRTDTASVAISMFVNNANVSDLWSLDVLGIKDPAEKTSQLLKEQHVEENFLKTAVFTKENRFSVDLPWVEDHAPISDNFELAKKRLEKTVEKLKKEDLYFQYDQIFTEWIKEGIIEPVAETEASFGSHYLPHRPVVKEESATTKIRPVFDASASTLGYPSLNQCLEKGPNLIELIPAALLKFREHDIAVLADIRKAFLQIEINPKDRDYLRFLWFVDGKLSIFRHKRVVFGLKCSPFLLSAVLKLHFSNLMKAAKENQGPWSVEDINKLSNSFYVDNCITSVKSTDELHNFMDAAKDMMASGNFDLRGWEYTHDNTSRETTKVLGLLFNKERDTILINPESLKNVSDTRVTKRSILSTAHRIFDPIGFTAPVSLLSKLLLKDLWEKKLDWDSPVSEQTLERFMNWQEQLKYLEAIEIPRKFGSGKFSFHTFCDASQLAYAAVTFLRVEKDNKINLILLAAKSRIAPRKITIPRLELLAASIGTRQAREVVDTLGYVDAPVFFWSDSTTVLGWLQRDIQWAVFVWNRVREIRQLTGSGIWKYVPGELNPADLPSRGCQAKQLLESRWWEGPEWLRRKEADWPQIDKDTDEAEVNNEIRRTAQTTLLSTKSTDKMQIDFNIADKFSSYNKMMRFFAIMIKFKNFLLTGKLVNGKRLTYKEINSAEVKFLKFLQNKMFFKENKKRLSALPIFTHHDGLIRLKTRILERDDDFSFLYPIVLDAKDRAVELLIRETHENLCHAGVQTVMCQLREKFWILSTRKTVRSVLNKCVTCKRFNALPMRAHPAPLPIHCVKDAAVFEVIGVDFAGPVILRRHQKAWICLFTCAIYRAVHLELVTSLSTKAFLASFRRFIAHHGRPAIVYSDHGTNFVGADNAFNSIDWGVVANYSHARRIDWRFNPPTAAWWGGWWERLIGMLKSLLRKVLGKACFDYEELCTILCDCKATLNSRPLTYLSEECDDLKPLTPAMFMMNDNRLNETPDLDIVNKVDLSSRYKRQQDVMDHLRKRFRKEYLGHLIATNNRKETRIIKEGDIVLIGDDGDKRMDWPLARVNKLILGRDGTARVAILKTQRGLCKRPIQRVYPLELSCSNDQEAKTLRDKIECNNASDPLVIDNNNPLAEACEIETCKMRSGRIVKKPCRLRD